MPAERFPVEAGHVLAFARAIGDPNPAYVDGGTDEVAQGIDLAHRRGIAVHAKLITFFMFKAPSEFQRRMIRADRVMRGPDGRAALQTGYAWLCPTQPANREQLAAEVTELLSRYRVDGLQFDYIRFYEEPTCYCDHCRAEFERSLGVETDRAGRIKVLPDLSLPGHPRVFAVGDCRLGGAAATDLRPRVLLGPRARPSLAATATDLWFL